MRRIAIAGTFTLGADVGSLRGETAANTATAQPGHRSRTESGSAASSANSGADPCRTAARGSAGDQRARQERRLGDLQNTGVTRSIRITKAPRRHSIASRYELQTFSCSQERRSPTLRLVTASAGWQRPLLRETRETLCRISQLSRKLRASRPTLRSTRRSTSTTCCSARAEATRCRRSSSTTPTS